MSEELAQDARRDSLIEVFKLGGSLLDLADLVRRVEGVLAGSNEGRPEGRVAVVVGGGLAAEAVRGFDRVHGLSRERSHELAVRAMGLNTQMVGAVFTRWRVVRDAPGCAGVWAGGDVALVDPVGWLERDAAAGFGVVKRWEFTSDSIAAHVARRVGAGRLTLLKSAWPVGLNEAHDGVQAAVEQGLVDLEFVRASEGIARVDVINLRDGGLRRVALRGG